MSSLREAAEEYLALRRALGFKLRQQGRMLLQFVEFLEQQRRDSDQHQARAAVGLPASGRQSNVVASAAGGRASLRAVPRGVRSADRGAAQRPAASAPSSRDPIPLLRYRDRAADRSSPSAHAAADGRDLRDPDRALIGDRDARRGSDRA